MTHGQIFKLRTRPTYQCCSVTDNEREICCKGGRDFNRPVWYLKAPSLSIYTQRRRSRRKSTCSRSKDPIHSKIISKHCFIASAICTDNRWNFKRNCYTSLRSFSPQRPEAWTQRENLLDHCSWNTALTDYPPTKSSKPTNFWFRKKSGEQVVKAIT
jgi:hypothetical protein